MIKCNVTINGIVSRTASMRTNKEGKSYISFAVKISILAKAGSGKQVEVFVSKNGTTAELLSYVTGQRIELKGVLTFRKREENLYLNFHADSVDFHPQSERDAIEGTIEFRGTVGKQVEEKRDKKGNAYSVFSAFSTEKHEENFAFTWVRFIRFSAEKESWLQPKARICAKGVLELSIYLDKINLSCRVEEMAEWVKPVMTNGTEDELPF